MSAAKDQAEKLRFWFQRHQVHHPEGQVFVYPPQSSGAPSPQWYVLALALVCVVCLGIAGFWLYQDARSKRQAERMAMSQAREKLERGVAAMQSHMQALSLELESARQEKKSIEKELSDLSVDNADLLGRVNMLREDNRLLQQEFVQTQQELTTMIKSKAEIQESMSNEVSLLRRKIDYLQQAVSGFSAPAERSGPGPDAGKIVEVNPDLRFAVIDRGLRHGLQLDTEYEVWRGQLFVGSLRILELRENVSAGEILPDNAVVREGDEVRLP